MIEKCRLCWTNGTERGVCSRNSGRAQCKCLAIQENPKTYYQGDFCERVANLEPTSLTSNGAIAGIIVSSVIAVIAVVLISYLLGRAYLRRQQQHPKDK